MIVDTTELLIYATDYDPDLDSVLLGNKNAKDCVLVISYVFEWIWMEFVMLLRSVGLIHIPSYLIHNQGLCSGIHIPISFTFGVMICTAKL